MIGYTIIVLWLIWAAYWIVTAVHMKTPKTRQAGSPWAFLLPLLICDLLLIVPFASVTLISLPITGLNLVIVGLALACWARYHLGGNWTGALTIQRGHTLVCTGPYAIIRHPIYVGLFVAFLGTGVFLGEVHTYVAPLFALAAFAYKARIEERQLLKTFPVEYRAYQKATLF